ncbi:MAG: hypothetical protein QOD02_3709, partial [Mycobacterium sp.]|nr:hypothetical protein [Mycobacterium sp.]
MTMQSEAMGRSGAMTDDKMLARI